MLKSPCSKAVQRIKAQIWPAHSLSYVDRGKNEVKLKLKLTKEKHSLTEVSFGHVLKHDY